MDPTSSAKAGIHQFPLRHYNFEVSLDRLKRGIDNVRHDVLISPDFQRMANRLVFQLILHHAEVSAPFRTESRFHWHNESAEFKRQCHAILLHGINMAKSAREIQLDVLAQIALIKLLSEAISQQFEEAVQHLKTVIRKKELANPGDLPLALREEVSGVIYREEQIIQKAGADLFKYFIEVQHELNKLRISNFGEASIIPPEILSNPILQSTGRLSGFFMIEHYVLIGHRIEDPVNYNSLLNLLTHFLAHQFNPGGEAADAKANPGAERPAASRFKPEIVEISEARRPELDSIIRHVPNIDLLFNFYRTRASLKKLKSDRKTNQGQILKLRERARMQKRLLNQFFRLISKEFIIDGIVAPYVMQPLFKLYCPPLLPQECLQYLIITKARKTIIRKLNRFKRYYSQNLSLGALNQTTRRIKLTSRAQKRRYLIRFLNDFSRYHRDLMNYRIIKDTADTINLRTEAKSIRLSRENRTLYEFVLSHEEGEQTRPIANHAVIKADIRGSSAIIDRMKAKQQNPATSFSLNFFEPINNVLALYGAQKTFIEGDAIILSIFEHAGTPGEWYSVSRACGLAINILLIVSRYNLRNRINRLPMLDIGIGIGYADAAPTFFYDGDNQIMISPAINKADRLSECNKSMRRKLRREKHPFNVYLYRPVAENPSLPLPKTGLLRYNVKGIELDPAGFQKLAGEIHLDRMKCRIPDLSAEPLVFHTGKFPTTGGRYQRLLIREARIPEVALPDFRVIRYTDRKYYEVCTNRAAYAHVRKYF
jgi:hypothetical protein